jgi:hypothetical protein
MFLKGTIKNGYRYKSYIYFVTIKRIKTKPKIKPENFTKRETINKNEQTMKIFNKMLTNQIQESVKELHTMTNYEVFKSMHSYFKI